MATDFGAFTSIEDAERKLRAATHFDHAKTINSHADAIDALNQHHQDMHAAIAKLKDQMDCVLDSLTQINQRLDALEAVVYRG